MFIKLDLKKACDRKEWDFIKETLYDAKLPNKLITFIMQCISNGTCRLLWNGEKTVLIKPTKGLHQGDPLSSYIFVLCMEGLAHCIQSKWEKEFGRRSRLREMAPQSHISSSQMISYCLQRRTRRKLKSLWNV